MLDRAQHVEAVEPRHLHVEEHRVGAQLIERGDRGDAIAALGGDLEVGVQTDEVADSLAREWLVVDDHHAERHVRSSNGRNGSCSIARNPPPAGRSVSSRAASPYSRCSRSRMFARPTPVPAVAA
jgi:hypothetical protein